MSIAKTTRPYLLTREAAAARIEALEAALREIAKDDDGPITMAKLARAALDQSSPPSATE
jgi:hypothetical protein